MPRFSAWILVAAVACAVPASADAVECGQGQPPRSKSDPPQGAKPSDSHDSRSMWWKVPESRLELGISDQQSKEIDGIFQSTRPLLKSGKEELDKLDEALSKLMRDSGADIESVRRQVVQLEQTRAKVNQTRTMMLYRMHRVLSPEQRVKLNAMFQRWEAERRKLSSEKSDKSEKDERDQRDHKDPY